jgi:hypothetical protein
LARIPPPKTSKTFPARTTAILRYHHALAQVLAASRVDGTYNRLLVAERSGFHLSPDPASSAWSTFSSGESGEQTRLWSYEDLRATVLRGARGGSLGKDAVRRSSRMSAADCVRAYRGLGSRWILFCATVAVGYRTIFSVQTIDPGHKH